MHRAAKRFTIARRGGRPLFLLRASHLRNQRSLRNPPFHRGARMNKNMGTIDRIVRILVALAAAALILSGALAGLSAVILGVVAGVFLLTSAVGFCPAYRLVKFST